MSSFSENNAQRIGQSQQKIRILTARLDDWISPEQRINYIKIDVEGAEQKVLEGACRTIRSNRPFICFEHHKFGVESLGVSSLELYNLIRDGFSYDIYRLSDWLHGTFSLRADEFLEIVQNNEEVDFLAVPNNCPR